MTKVLIVREPGSTTPHAWYYCLPGEDEDLELSRAEEAHRARGHTCFVVDHDGPAETMHHGDAVEHIAKRSR